MLSQNWARLEACISCPSFDIKHQIPPSDQTQYTCQPAKINNIVFSTISDNIPQYRQDLLVIPVIYLSFPIEMATSSATQMFCSPNSASTLLSLWTLR